jgi:hypothetical protein
VKLCRNDLGSWVIEVNGNFVGWIHANLGDKWIAYVRGDQAGDPGQLLGRFTKNEAVRRIALAAGWRPEPD